MGDHSAEAKSRGATVPPPFSTNPPPEAHTNQTQNPPEKCPQKPFYLKFFNPTPTPHNPQKTDPKKTLQNCRRIGILYMAKGWGHRTPP